MFKAATSAGLLLLLINNPTSTIWARATSKSGLRIGTIYEGECGTVRHADSWLHIAISAMGTLLLGASNYTIQCLKFLPRGVKLTLLIPRDDTSKLDFYA
jgi:hypothetical protein